MPHEVALITTIAVAFGLALLLGLVAVRPKLPARKESAAHVLIGEHELALGMARHVLEQIGEPW
jgi:hypothetical protein